MDFDFSVVYDSDENEFDGLDMYYGARSMQGISEAIAIATHGIVNERFISKSTAAKGFKNRFKTSFEGSFKQRFRITFTSPETISKITTLGAKSYLELLKHTINQVTGSDVEITRRTAKAKARKMYFSEDITHRLTTSLKEVHTPIKHQGYKATLYAGQTPLAVFNQRSLSYLEEEIPSAEREVLVVGISRFNARTGTGRLIFDLDEDSYSFVPSMPLTRAVKRDIIASLRGVADNELIPLRAEVTRVTLNDESTKYFRIHQIQKIQPANEG
ncbi:hypothetical protein VUG52_23335 [Pseudomonas sp. LH21]|uniref:DUF7946 domain-containing protein n=1 Tax=Pseudomonas sp. LH21 TaxID=3114884 RepID=UPI002F92D0FA